MSDSKLPAPIEPPGALVPAQPMTQDERWQLIRAMVRFQFKLLVDGLKDIVLGPLSLVAGAFDLARGTPVSESWFRSVLRSGSRFDAWVNLFEDQHPPASLEPGARPVADLDAHLRRIEELVLEQHRRGGITANAKQAIDHALDVLEAQSSRLTKPLEDGAKDDRSA